jgi:hypothetical protein
MSSWPVSGSGLQFEDRGSRALKTRASRPGSGPGRLWAGSYRSGLEILIRNLALRWGASFPGQKRSGVFRELLIRVWA